MAIGSNGNAVSDQAAEYLTPSVEAEPDVDSTALFCFGIPLLCVRDD